MKHWTYLGYDGMGSSTSHKVMNVAGINVQSRLGYDRQYSIVINNIRFPAHT